MRYVNIIGGMIKGQILMQLTFDERVWLR